MLKRKADDVTLCASSVAHFEDIHRVSARSAEVRNLECGRVAWATPAPVAGLQMQEQGFDRRPSIHAKTAQGDKLPITNIEGEPPRSNIDCVRASRNCAP